MNKNNNEVGKEAVSWIKTIAIALALALFITSFIIVNAKVPTGSMMNTIMPGDRIVALRLSYTFGEPERCDIAVFKLPDDPKVLYVKRVIGLPGEKIEVKNGKVYIDGELNEEVDKYIKEQAYGDYGPYVVPEGCYFMMGDNRNNSLDSRFWNEKFVKEDYMLGKAVFKYYPGFKLLD